MFNLFSYKSPSNSPFSFCSLGNLIYGLSEISNALETATSPHNQHLLLASLNHSFSVGFVPESHVLSSRETCLVTDKKLILLGASVMLFKQTV